MPRAPSSLFCVPTNSHLIPPDCGRGKEEDKLLVCVTRKQCVSKPAPLILSEAGLALSAGVLTLMDEHFKVSLYSGADTALWGVRVPAQIHSPAHMVASPAWTLPEPVLDEAKQGETHDYLIPCDQSQSTTMPPWTSLTHLFLFCLKSLGGFSASHAEPVPMIHANKGSGVAQRT